MRLERDPINLHGMHKLCQKACKLSGLLFGAKIRRGRSMLAKRTD